MAKNKKTRGLPTAKYAALTSRAVTGRAKDLVSDLVRELSEAELRWQGRAHRRSPRAKQRLQAAVEAFVGDLLLAQTDDAPQGWVYRPTRPQSFTGQAIGYREFTSTRKGLERLGLVRRKRGLGWSGDPSIPVRDMGTRFCATPRLLDRAEQHGVPIAEIADHFVVTRSTNPRQLRAGVNQKPRKR
jgi:hypothetical protein